MGLRNSGSREGLSSVAAVVALSLSQHLAEERKHEGLRWIRDLDFGWRIHAAEMERLARLLLEWRKATAGGMGCCTVIEGTRIMEGEAT